MHFYRWAYSLKDCITCLNSYSTSHQVSSEAYSDDEKRSGTIKKEYGTKELGFNVIGSGYFF